MQSLRLQYGVIVVLTVRDVPDEVRGALAREARSRGQSLQAYLLGVLTRQAAFTRNAEVLADIERSLVQEGGADLNAPSAAEVIEDARRGRTEPARNRRRVPGGAA